jgi:ABC-type amino acid transport substrate-binding protein
VIRACRTVFLACLMAAASLAPVRAAELGRVGQPWKGDLSRILAEHRPIRVLVAYNRTNFFLKEGVVRGLEADMMRAYEEHLAKTRSKELIRLVFVPVRVKDLFPALLDGRGDVIAAGRPPLPPLTAPGSARSWSAALGASPLTGPRTCRAAGRPCWPGRATPSTWPT